MIDLLIVNYNLPEMVDLITTSLQTRLPHRWIIVDNGSDLVVPHPASNVFVKKNDEWISGLSVGLEHVTAEYVWIFTTSMGAVHCANDPLEELLKVFEIPNAVTVTPAWVGSLNAATHKKFARGAGDFENIGWATPAALWKADYLKAKLERRCKSGWGSDYDLAYKTRADGLTCWRCNNVTVDIHEHAGYETGRRHISLQDRERRASEEMIEVLYTQYGPEWRSILGVM